MEGQLATTLADGQNNEKIIEQNQERADSVRGDEPGAGRGVWIACNEVTRKFCRTPQSDAMGWAMRTRDGHWFSRVRDVRGEWSFGPATERRAMQATEAWIRHEPFAKQEGERMWSGEYYKAG